MKATLLIIIYLMAGCILLFRCNEKRQTNAYETNDKLDQQELIQQGNYLVSVSGCHDCHSPKIFGPHGPEPDPERLLMGHPVDLQIASFDTVTSKSWILFNPDLTASVGPWGVSFAANLTSDPTGIGNWTEEHFFTAIREGKYKGMRNGRNLLPPMPWPMVAKMTDDDLRAIFAYLKSVKPIRNVPPAPISPAELAMRMKTTGHN